MKLEPGTGWGRGTLFYELYGRFLNVLGIIDNAAGLIGADGFAQFMIGHDRKSTTLSEPRDDLAGRFIGEPIVREGPFVMNLTAEIQTAIRDYHAGALNLAWPSHSLNAPVLIPSSKRHSVVATATENPKHGYRTDFTCYPPPVTDRHHHGNLSAGN